MSIMRQKIRIQQSFSSAERAKNSVLFLGSTSVNLKEWVQLFLLTIYLYSSELVMTPIIFLNGVIFVLESG
jgi:hypothetical protein